MIKKVGVVGAGMMGAEIAICFARAGYETVLSDVNQELADNGKVKQAAVLDKNIKKGKITEEDKEKTLARVHATADMHDMKRRWKCWRSRAISSSSWMKSAKKRPS